MQNNTFSTLFVGQNLIRLSEVDSTNNFLKTKASNSEPLPEGTVIMADKQFAGRGQQQNTWYAEPGLNLTFSIYLCPSFLAVSQQFLLNMAVSVALRDALGDLLGPFLKVKWPNDLYYKNQKLGGILIENIIAGTTYKACIIGIGLNVNQQSFDPKLLGRATSVWKILQQDVNLIELLSLICSNVEAEYLKLKSGNVNKLQSDYINGLYLFNEPALYRHNGQSFKGRIVNVSQNGLLTILSDAVEREFNFKEVEFLNNI
ncbi:BirA family transcriptional regulator, biotin operon repressor / biotin-[acetyl-CoA-carboxylase] ligase [Pedobacter africanus]|uniref:BirA family transcriptional regulator, biotin operon repressor / biotin-[acetyl-CoA-carboxylase] ligase n=1 Tax=Pedobacter africanus TaxID=151894 RepID=A0A1W2BB66_9SPHI|nr:BirA family transcriptional regulator, biotin operon repressor / biotin-[acetyl-CoA-carboxylase] ligase [Pedobacter africanus]